MSTTFATLLYSLLCECVSRTKGGFNFVFAFGAFIESKAIKSSFISTGFRLFWFLQLHLPKIVDDKIHFFFTVTKFELNYLLDIVICFLSIGLSRNAPKNLNESFQIN